MMNYKETNTELKTWIHFKMTKLNCSKENVKILYTDNTKNDAEELFKDSNFTCDHWNTLLVVKFLLLFVSSLQSLTIHGNFST